MLRVGDYEKPIIIEKEDGWQDMAEDALKDVKTWVVANRTKLRP